ncbi:hypothetical protein, unknown function [Leishmania braziliensis MHOM/BR/75/M2904]|uniref:RING-type domain-containing protein n=2 Tax=Leishmania braziliensis TaxID=5660 RepID=A4H5U9_LEIBR|nr:hypothetical protein, unknown function [Leishmania braziliensis MHOM/BR/75/M2904]KAI5690756.1 zinc finger protein [Leishmania braziliensis]CAJ2467584.1 unnamed protein product [Leishmania braziliensis]CAJ2468147.1 unnamed protein product [Leishmania braziliensis]CAM41865.1 hypothetical protein, unknown function [Leishmania braziliensis MHOM/BR/75/M2904]SYZ63344.1 Zinc_finger [Leishmania braziliensis MHOM/BR/75/M2904]
MSRVAQHSSAASASVGERATLFLMTLFVVLGCSGAVQNADARLERQTYVAYRTPHLCSYEIMVSVACPQTKPVCCVASSAIRCCAGTTSCGNCTDDIVGYEMPKSSAIIGCFSLSVLVLLGSIIMSGVGRHLAWVLERRRVIENYRKHLLLRRAEAREFKKELAETEVKDIDDAVGCVICCSRHIDVALTPCGHVCCCRFCAKRLRECPVCRSALQRCFDLPLYYVKQLLSASGTEEKDNGSDGRESPSSPTEMYPITGDGIVATTTWEARVEDICATGQAACAPATTGDCSVESAMAPSGSSCCWSSVERPRRSTIRVIGAVERGMINPFRGRYTRVQSSEEDEDERNGRSATCSTPLVPHVPPAGAATSPTEVRITAADDSAQHSYGCISREK